MCAAYIYHFGGWLRFDEKDARLLASFNQSLSDTVYKDAQYWNFENHKLYFHVQKCWNAYSD